MSQLLQKTRVNSLASFLTTELQGVDKSVAARIVAELGAWAQEDTPKGVAATSTKVGRRLRRLGVFSFNIQALGEFLAMCLRVDIPTVENSLFLIYPSVCLSVCLPVDR